MKRLNPKTNLPFKYGDVREDGLIFLSYQTSRIKKDGFFIECWVQDSALKNYRVRKKLTKAKSTLTNLGRAKKLIESAKKRAKDKNTIITITPEWVKNKIDLGVCEISKLPFSLEKPKPGFRNNPYSPSLDRIDNSNPNYTPDNCRVILTVLNQAISDYGLNTLIKVFTPVIKPI